MRLDSHGDGRAFALAGEGKVRIDWVIEKVTVYGGLKDAKSTMSDLMEGDGERKIKRKGGRERRGEGEREGEKVRARASIRYF